MRFLRPVQSTRLSPFLSLVRSGRHSSALDGASPDLCHRQRRATYLLGNRYIGQPSVFTIRVTEQQDAGAHLFPDAAPTRTDNHL